MMAAEEAPPSSVAQRLVFVAACVVVGVLVAVPAGWLWIQLADPPSATVTQTGLDSGERFFDEISTITLWFAAVGVGFGAVLGLTAGLLGRRHGLATVMAVVVACAAATFVSAWCGEHWFGPPDPVDFVALLTGDQNQFEAVLEGREPGDELVSAVSLTTPAAYLGWPVGGMAGVLAGVVGWPKAQKRADMARPSDSLTHHQP